MKIVVIGAGIGGLTTAAVLAKAGAEVTVLEAHIYPGGCAGTFYHQKYRFDAGATLAAGFYPGGPMDQVAQATGIREWPAHPAETAMSVHLPNKEQIDLVGDPSRWELRRKAFGENALSFFRWQEKTANHLWDLALRRPPWPPQSTRELLRLGKDGISWLADRKPPLHTLFDFHRPVSAHLKDASDDLRLFVDAQLLISAQTTSGSANALYGASALDLPRRGVVHLKGGMGALANSLAQAVRQNGGRIIYRQEVESIVLENDKPTAVITNKRDRFSADLVVANLPPWNLAKLMKENLPKQLESLPRMPQDGWGAFVVYLGLDAAALPVNLTLHHQIVLRRPLGEGNSVFVSISPHWDLERAPAGKRAVTISTHTQLEPWWDLFDKDREAYEARKRAYTERVLDAVQSLIPNLRDAVDLVLPGTPVTFQRFTRRSYGWVGGFPQTSLLRSWKPQLAPKVWMVGDSIFPGQSTAAVALGGLRVAESILHGMGIPQLDVQTNQYTYADIF